MSLVEACWKKWIRAVKEPVAKTKQAKVDKSRRAGGVMGQGGNKEER